MNDKQKRVHSGHWAWVSLATHIIFYDWLALRTHRPTLSETFHAISRSKFGPLVVGFWVYLSLHLVRFLPEAADVFRRGARMRLRHAEAKQQQVQYDSHAHAR